MARRTSILGALVERRGTRARAATAATHRDRVRAGLRYAALDTVARELDLDARAIAAILRLPARTLARRKTAGRLGAGESDRLYRLARIAALAEETLGGVERARRWLHAPNRALGHESPLACLDTDPGARQVEDVLLRIAHGVYT